MKQSSPDILVQPWRPIKWKPAYDIMVSMFITGYSHVEIADHLGYTAVQVGNIIRSPESQEIIKNFHEKSIESSLVDLPAKINKMRSKAFKRIEEVLDNDTLAEKSPAVMANVSMGLLKGIGSLNDGSTKIQNNINLPTVSNEHMKDLVSALRESNSIQSGDIQEASFEVINESKQLGSG